MASPLSHLNHFKNIFLSLLHPLASMWSQSLPLFMSAPNHTKRPLNCCLHLINKSFAIFKASDCLFSCSRCVFLRRRRASLIKMYLWFMQFRNSSRRKRHSWELCTKTELRPLSSVCRRRATPGTLRSSSTQTCCSGSPARLCSRCTQS